MFGRSERENDSIEPAAADAISCRSGRNWTGGPAKQGADAVGQILVCNDSRQALEESSSASTTCFDIDRPVARSAVLFRSLVILVATCGFGVPAFAADLQLPAAVPVPFDPALPVGLRPLSQVLSPDSTPSPFQLRLQYTGELWGNQGGLKTGEDYMENYAATLIVNTDKAFGWTGGKFVASGFYNDGPSLNNNFVGAVQDPSALDVFTPNMPRLYQLYYDQTIGNTNIRFGVMDLETEFGVTRPMDVFFNGAFAWNSALDASGAGGLNGPSTYPNTSLGIRVRQIINDQWSVQGAVVNGMSDSATWPQSNAITINSANGAFAIGEVDYTPLARTKIMAGYWRYTGLMDTQNEFIAPGVLRQVRGSDGGYIGGATRLYTIKDARGLDAFVNFGMSDPRENDVDRSVNAGLTFTGLFDSRPADKLGFATGYAHAGAPLQAVQLAQGNPITSYEQTFEITYRARLSDWLTVQPNLQYTIHPGFSGTLKNDFLFGLHFEVGHLFNL
jgi:porin